MHAYNRPGPSGHTSSGLPSSDHNPSIHLNGEPAGHQSGGTTKLIQFSINKQSDSSMKRSLTVLTWLFLSIFVIVSAFGCSCEDPEVKFQKLMSDAKTF